MPKLSDLQLILLTSANQRENGQVLPVPESISGAGPRLKKSLSSLLKRSLVCEIEAAAADQVWREEGGRQFSLVIADAGRAALVGGSGDSDGSSTTPAPAEAAPTRSPTKQDRVIELLKRQEGATLGELTGATAWLPHTMRAALTGLRKKGMQIDKTKREDVTCYCIRASA